MAKEHNISIIWDFDKTLTPEDSTSILISHFTNDIKKFWKAVKKTSGTSSKNLNDSISTSDAPVWMHSLANYAIDKNKKPIPLNKKEIGHLISQKINFYSKALDCLKAIKNLSNEKEYKENNVKVHNFIITAGLKDLVEYVLEEKQSSELVKEVFGCRYKFTKVNVPIYCMDKTTKTRSLFEIHKGCFLQDAKYKVDDLVPKGKEWCDFENMIYIGDGETDIPAFSLVQARRGMTIGVFNPNYSKDKIKEEANKIIQGKRIDLFTPAKFDKEAELVSFIKNWCGQIVKKISAHKYKNLP